VFLIRKGIIRTYILTDSGEEKTIRLAKERDFTTCAASFLKGKPSTEYLEVLEDCKVIAVNSKKMEELAKGNIRILRLLNEGLKESMYDAIERVEFFTIHTPEERYRKIMKESPNLFDRVQQKHLASYLGITTVSLSRIRNRKKQD
jgi:CRP-like cAMP-binding protein